MNNIMNKFAINRTYLIKPTIGIDSLYSVRIDLITEKAYHILWNASGQHTWELKQYFDEKYVIVEDISDYITTTPKEKNIFDSILNNELLSNKKCDHCNGYGYIEDHTTTAGKIPCPKCWGSKRIF